MAFLRTLRSRHFHTLLNPQNPPPSQCIKNPTTQFFHRPISVPAQFKSESISNQQTKKPLHVLFKEAVGLSEKIEPIEAENKPETNELKKRLRKLEEEVRRLKENSSEKVKVENLKKKKIENDESSSKGLYGLFANKGGYFVNANFLPNNKFDITCFENSYGRDFIRNAAEKFGKNNQEIVNSFKSYELKLWMHRWLSASDLKKVCSKCVLKSSCKFVNQSVWKGNNNNLNLAVMMRVIILYTMESVPPQLVVPDEIKASVSVLLKEVLNLSQTLA
ncbi:hypothetical protein ACSBR2_011849 [Camellia fascicularis]